MSNKSALIAMLGGREAAKKYLQEQTDPYGHLSYAIGNGEDFYCFGFYLWRDIKVIGVNSTINSETGGFIEGGPWDICDYDEAEGIMETIIDGALEWTNEEYIDVDGEDAVDSDGDPIQPGHDEAGWNQDEYYVLRDMMFDMCEMPWEERPERKMDEKEHCAWMEGARKHLDQVLAK